MQPSRFLYQFLYKTWRKQWVGAMLLGGSLLAACAAPLPVLPAAEQSSPPSAAQPARAVQPVLPKPENTTAAVNPPAPVPPEPVQVEPATSITNLTPEQQAILDQLPSRGTAPELANQIWLNSPPLKLADLRGKVVLIKFWTFG